MAMKNLLLLPVLLALVGCPLQVNMIIYNFTGRDVALFSKSGSISIRNAGHAKTDGNNFHFDRNPHGFEQIKLNGGGCYIISFSSAIEGPGDLFSSGEYKANVVLAREGAYFVPPSVDVSANLDLAKFRKLPLCHR